MAIRRIRSIKPEFWSDERLLVLDRDVRFTFLGLMCHADDYGRENTNSIMVKGSVWPLDEDITPAVLDDHILQLVGAEFVRLYTVGRFSYYEVIDWESWQKVDRPSQSRIPAPVGAPLASDSRASREGLAEEGKGAVRESESEWSEERENSRATRDTELPPSPFCRKHPEGTDAPCRPCGTARMRHEQWMTQRSVRFNEGDDL